MISVPTPIKCDECKDTYIYRGFVITRAQDGTKGWSAVSYDGKVHLKVSLGEAIFIRIAIDNHWRAFKKEIRNAAPSQ